MVSLKKIVFILIVLFVGSIAMAYQNKITENTRNEYANIMQQLDSHINDAQNTMITISRGLKNENHGLLSATRVSLMKMHDNINKILSMQEETDLYEARKDGYSFDECHVLIYKLMREIDPDERLNIQEQVENIGNPVDYGLLGYTFYFEKAVTAIQIQKPDEYSRNFLVAYAHALEFADMVENKEKAYKYLEQEIVSYIHKSERLSFDYTFDYKIIENCSVDDKYLKYHNHVIDFLSMKYQDAAI